jgi:hypothetical protein
MPVANHRTALFNKYRVPPSLNSSLKLEIARIPKWPGLMNIIPIWLGKLQRTFTKLVNNVEFETSKYESENDLDFQFRNFHSCTRMTSCDDENVRFISS